MQSQSGYLAIRLYSQQCGKRLRRPLRKAKPAHYGMNVMVVTAGYLLSVLLLARRVVSQIKPCNSTTKEMKSSNAFTELAYTYITQKPSFQQVTYLLGSKHLFRHCNEHHVMSCGVTGWTKSYESMCEKATAQCGLNTHENSDVLSNTTENL
jgi:hypothetical protein